MPDAAGLEWVVSYSSRLRIDGMLKPFLKQVAMPEVIAFFDHLGQPFCMDALHSRKDWNFNTSPEEQVKQD